MTESAVPAGFAVKTLPEVCQLAEILWKSNLFPGVASVNQAIVKILLGGEIGFGPLASMADVHIIEGRPSLGAHLRAAAIKRSEKYDYAILDGEHTDDVCAVEFFEHDGAGKDIRKGTKGWRSLGVIRYTIEDAKAKGWHLTQSGKSKSPWLKTPRNMLFARVLSDGYKFHCPDLSAGVLLYDADEMDSAPQESKRVEVVAAEPARLETNGSPQQAPQQTPPEVTSAAPVLTTASDLIAWLTDLERDLIAQGACSGGQLVLRVRDEGNRAGFLGPIADWIGPALQFAVQAGQAGHLWFARSGLISHIDLELDRLDIGAVSFTKRLKEKFGTDDPFTLSPEQLAGVLAKLTSAPTPAAPVPVSVS